MEHKEAPLGFGFFLNQNTAAMNHYAQLSEKEKDAVLQKAQNAQTREEMYTLVANIANGSMWQ